MSAKGNGNANRWGEVFLLAILIIRGDTVEICRILSRKIKKDPYAPGFTIVGFKRADDCAYRQKRAPLHEEETLKELIMIKLEFIGCQTI